MPFKKHNFSRAARGLHYPAFRKRKNQRNKMLLVIPVLLFLFLLTVLVVPSLAASASLFVSQTWLVIKADHSYPYVFLLRSVLPGLEREEIVLNKDPLLDYPNLLLDSQLVGFSARHTTPQENGAGEGPQAGSTGGTKDTGNENTVPGEQGKLREIVSYLGEAEPQTPQECPLHFEKRGGPLLLIYHTHATESFMPDSGCAFTQDADRTVVALGSLLAQILENKYGIPVLHHKGVFDLPRSYAYEKARPEIERLLKDNPQIKAVLDLHRDGVARRVTTTTLNGLQAGRLLFVLGTRHQGWQNNLRFYYLLQGFLEEKYPGLSRGILKNNFVYNQNLHERSLIVEIGGHENSLEEAKRSIPCLAEAVAGIFE